MLFNSLVYPVGILATLSSLVHAAPYCAVRPPRDESSAPSTSPAAPSNATRPAPGDVWASAWYPGWLGDHLNQVAWSKFNVMTFAFGITTPDPSVISLDATSQALLPAFVRTANENDVSALLSLGGWTGSQYFSSAVATAESRTTFVNAVIGLVQQYNLDGIDFDWEYPNRQGVGCNEIAPEDSANFLLFLQELRAHPIGSQMILTAAAGITPFAGPSGSPLTDVSEFAKVFDHLAIMNYDIWGRWSQPGVGPNAPLDDTCSSNQAGSAVSAVRAWTSAGFPASKLGLGVAAYGHSYHVERSAAVDSAGQLVPYPPFDASLQPRGDSQDGEAGVDQCGNPVPVGGIFNFWGLIEGGFLNADGTAASGIDYRFDNCSQTPFVYNPQSQVMVSYDDAASLAAKGRFINEMGLGGFAMWHVLGDSNDILIDSISAAMGVRVEEEVCEPENTTPY
ncbi:hypothetical protein AX16_007668 [Volvariella volvacea WC 439]|nr:hypothetical protein AX16_007668 [Volvariella volvacea WC 439]